jgi:hypothetical protein
MTIKYKEVILQPRQMGISLEDTEADKIGRALFEKVPGSGVFEEFEVKAIEYVRQNHEVWVVDTENGVTEHTPQEVKYEDALGVPHRVGEDYPLPVSMGRKAVTYVTKTCTASGNTELVAAPGAGYKLRVHYFSYSNLHTTLADVGMRFGGTGDIKHRHALAAEGGNVNANLTDCNWEGSENEALNAYLAAGYSTGIYITVGYTTESV